MIRHPFAMLMPDDLADRAREGETSGLTWAVLALVATIRDTTPLVFLPPGYRAVQCFEEDVWTTPIVAVRSDAEKYVEYFQLTWDGLEPLDGDVYGYLPPGMELDGEMTAEARKAFADKRKRRAA